MGIMVGGEGGCIPLFASQTLGVVEVQVLYLT